MAIDIMGPHNKSRVCSAMANWQQISEHIEEKTGRPFHPGAPGEVGGGCINAAFTLADGEQKYFVKVNQASRQPMFVAEAAGLQEIVNTGAIRVPRPVCYGISGNDAYLVMEHIAFGRNNKDSLVRFGQQLAGMHLHTQPQFGLDHDNTIGSTLQPNQPCDDWIEFWQQHRLGFQLQLAADNGGGASLQKNGEKLLAGLDCFFTGYTPVASLLHGDLWSGNYAVDNQGQPVIYDPAVYYGDHEADLAMTELFGSLPQDFYSAYNDVFPIDPGYRTRKTLYNLYHILNHFNLFGGGYRSQAEAMISDLLSEVR
ncbi:MAG: fructosamine kinase family protein [Gammaproteobacteria bacterium]|nr:MAG: fructosamine kinase family protein [Gammaproteobacteria bacterium]